MRILAAQLSRPPAGADRVVVMPGAVIVLDGASAFGPATVSPAAYTDRLGTEIASAISASPAGPLPKILATAITATAAALNLYGDDGPSSTVAIARVSNGVADLLLLGDSYIAYRSAGTAAVLTDDRLDHPRLPQARLYRDRLAAGSGFGPAHTATLRKLQAWQRARRNAPGYWIASASPEAAKHPVTLALPVASLDWIILATDGAVDTARHLGLDDWEAIARSDQSTLSGLLQQCHAWERTPTRMAASTRAPKDTTTRPSPPSG